MKDLLSVVKITLPEKLYIKEPETSNLGKRIVENGILLIDEVSMVDLPMMTRIFRALKANTKVILLGDADQLPSVAVGSVLADIAPRPHSGYSAENYHYLAQSCQLDEQVLKNAFPNQSSVHSASDHLSLLMKMNSM